MKCMRLPLLWIATLLILYGCSGDSKPVTTGQMGGAKQGKPLALSRSVTTLAGPTLGAADGIGVLARFERPSSLTSDGINLYIADSDDHTIRKMVIATGEVTTLAGKPGVWGTADGTGTAARFLSPSGITNDGTNLYVADGNNLTVRKVVIATGAVTTLAGSAGSWGHSDGIGTTARFSWVEGIATDGTNVYVADATMIRKIALATTEVTTLAGGPPQYTQSGSNIADGIGASAKFGSITGIASDGTNLYVADNNTIRKVVTATGNVTTLAGNSDGPYGPMDGVGAAAGFGYVAGIATDGLNVYFSDSDTVRKLDIATAQVSTLAGRRWNSGFTDGTGPAARFYGAAGIVVAGANLFIGDTGNRVIRKLELTTSTVTTAAGTSASGSSDGQAATAAFLWPRGITTDGRSLYVADSGNYTIRKIDIATGLVTTLAGSPGNPGTTDGAGPAARFRSPQGITTDGTSLYITDQLTIRKLDVATGAVTTFAGSGNWGTIDGTGTTADFYFLQDITTDGTTLFVADQNRIRKVVIATGVVTTLAGSTTSGWADGTGPAATFGWISGLTTDGVSLFVADHNNLIRKVTIATGEVATLAGNPLMRGSTDGYGTEAAFYYLKGLTTDGTSVFITDETTIRKLTLATGEVTTIAGSPSRSTSKDGVGGSAGFLAPAGITTDGRSLFVTDGIGSIRRID